MEQKFSSLARALVESQQRILSTEKEDAVILANNLKLQQLAEFNKQREEEDQYYRSNTTAGMWGIDPTADPILHTTVNTAARIGAVGSRIIGQVAAGVEGAFKEGLGTGGIDENIREARARELKGEATQADLRLLDYAPRPLYGAASSKVKGQSNRERIQHWEKTQDDLAKTKEFFNIDNRVDRRVDRPFQEELKQGAATASADFSEGSAKLDNKDYLGALANYASGAGTLAKNVATAGVNNPLGAFNAVVENSPQLAAGIAFGLPGTLAVAGAYATDAYQEALEKYREEHNGAMPSKDWQKARMMEAAALMGAETVSDRLTLGAGKAVSSGIKSAQEAVEGTNAPVAPATSSQVTTAPEPTSVDTTATGAASVQLPTNPANVPAASTAPVSVAPGTDNIGHVNGKPAVIDPGAVEVAKAAPAGIVLPVTGKYTAKDQEKANKASKFIGRGAPGSSTDVYAKAYGNLANSGTYTAADVVFVSVNGSRADRVEANYDEIGLAMEAGATILTDKQADRDRPYNKVGEGAVAEYLAINGYVEVKPGEWVPASKAFNESKSTSSIAKVISAISKKYPDRNISEPTQEQSAVIASALKEVVAALGDDFAYPNHIVIFEHSSTKGMFFYEENSLGLNKSLFESGLPSFGITDPVQAVKTIVAHEMAHGRDQGAAFPSQQAKSLREGGVFYREAKAVVDAGEAHPLYLWYKNAVFRASNNGDTIASELYAQMFTLYAVNKELLQEHLPKTYEKVTQAIEKSSAQNQRREAAEVVRPVYDGGRDTAVSEESKPQEQATEGPRVSGVEAEAQEQVEQAEVENEASAKLAALKDAILTDNLFLSQFFPSYPTIWIRCRNHVAGETTH